MAQTLRITKTTFSTEHVAPDGSHRFPAGLVVEVREGAQTIDEATAKRWVRNGFAEEYRGVPGTRVNEQTRQASPAELASQIAALQAELQQRTQAEGIPHVGYVSAEYDPAAGGPFPADAQGRGGYVGRTSAGTLTGEAQTARVPSDQPVGRTPYQDPTAPHPLGRYDLPERQRVALEQAGFTRPDLIDGATDEALLDVEGVGEGTLKKLRGG